MLNFSSTASRKSFCIKLDFTININSISFHIFNVRLISCRFNPSSMRASKSAEKRALKAFYFTIKMKNVFPSNLPFFVRTLHKAAKGNQIFSSFNGESRSELYPETVSISDRALGVKKNIRTRNTLEALICKVSLVNGKRRYHRGGEGRKALNDFTQCLPKKIHARREMQLVRF